MIFRILYYLKLCLIFVGSVHNFRKSDDDKIWWKMLIFNRCISGLMPNLIKKPWTDSTTYVVRTYVYMPAWLMELHRKLGTLLIDWSRHDRPAHHLLSNFCYQCHSTFFSLLTQAQYVERGFNADISRESICHLHQILVVYTDPRLSGPQIKGSSSSSRAYTRLARSGNFPSTF